MHTTATRVATFFTIMLLGLAASAQPAQAQVGILGGLNFSNLGDIERSSTTFDNSTGYHIGAFVDFGLGPVDVRPAVIYHRIGTYELQQESFDLNAIEVPIDLRFTVLPTPIVKPYLLAGPVLTFPQGEDEFEDGVEDLSLTADIGAGFEVSLPGVGLTFMPELRYGIGVTNYLQDDFEVLGTEINPESGDQRLSKFMLRLNIKF
jgi:hypothetical protein